jgi:hypothetical protein
MLIAAEKLGYEVLLTADRNLSYQQNLSGRAIAIVVLNTNHWGTIRQDAARVVDAVNRCAPGSFIEVAFDRSRAKGRAAKFSRRQPCAPSPPWRRQIDKPGYRCPRVRGALLGAFVQSRRLLGTSRLRASQPCVELRPTSAAGDISDDDMIAFFCLSRTVRRFPWVATA